MAHSRVALALGLQNFLSTVLALGWAPGFLSRSLMMMPPRQVLLVEMLLLVAHGGTFSTSAERLAEQFAGICVDAAVGAADDGLSADDRADAGASAVDTDVSESAEIQKPERCTALRTDKIMFLVHSQCRSLVHPLWLDRREETALFVVAFGV